MDTEKTNELVTKVYAEIQNGFKRVDQRLSSLEGEMQGMKDELQGVKDDVQGVKSEVNSLKYELNGVKEGVQGVKDEVQSVKGEVMSVKETVSRIEVEHGQKLSALFDGHKQNSQKLDRIETEVKKHDEFIMKRIK